MGEGFGAAAASPVRVWPPASSAPVTRTWPHPFRPASGIATLRRFLGTLATVRPTSCFPAPRSQPTSKQKVGSMLKLMRDSFHHLKWILLAIVAAFIIGFVYVDMGLGGANQTKQQDTRAYAARVNGETISFREYERALYYSEKNYEQMYRQPLSQEMIEGMGLPKQVLDSLVDQHLLLQQAARLHLTATPQEVRAKLLQIPVLNQGGKFVREAAYTRYVTGSLR